MPQQPPTTLTPKSLREVDDLRRERLRRLAVVLLAVLDFGQPRVRQHRDGQRRVLAKVTDALRHVARAGAAVHPDDIDGERFERGQRGADLRPVEHRAEDLDGHLRDDGDASFDLLEVIEDGGQRRLRLQQVLARLDDEQIGAAVHEAAHLHAVGVTQFFEGGVAERRQLRPRPDGAGDPPRALLRRVVARHALRQLRRLEVQLVGHVRDLVLGEHDGRAAERVGLDHVAPDIEEARVNLLDRRRLTDEQVLRAALELRAAVVLQRQVLRLETRPHRAVEDDDALFQRVEKISHRKAVSN